MNKEGIKFLNKLYKDLHLSKEVMHTALKRDDKNLKIKRYLERLENVNNLANDSKYNGIELLKELYYNKYVIKEENVPDSYFDLQKKIAFERGYGEIEIAENKRKEGITTIIKDQKYSLDLWLDYFLSEDTNMYPMWFKYYAFQGMLSLGEYDKEKKAFKKRTDKTTVKFIDLNREALSYTYDILVKSFKKDKIEEKELETLVNGGSFQKIYTYFIRKIDSSKKGIVSDGGIWRVFKQGSNPEILVNTLEGKGTGWCTAGIETAKQQLQGGDFHIYYTKTENGDNDQPRIAIRMDGNKIGEIRGIAAHQNLELEMESVLQKKLEEFPDKDKYLKKVNDMEKLTNIYNERISKELSIDEIRFLYEIDSKIDGFGYEKDPRIEEIINNRNFKEDLIKVFNCKEEEISNNPQDVLDGKRIVYFYGDLDLSSLKSAKGLVLPNTIGGNLYLNKLTSAEGLVLPNTIESNLDLGNLTSAKGLVFPNTIGGNLYLDKLTSAEGLVFPNTIGGNLYLNKLTSAESLVFPTTIWGDLILNSLTSAEGLVLPNTIKGSLDLRNLTSAEGLILPTTIKGSLDLRSLTSAESLVFPNTIGGNLHLDNLTNAKGLVLPNTLESNLYLNKLTSAKGLVFPDTICGSLILNNLRSAEGLILPTTIWGDLYLIDLTSAEGLVLPNNIRGRLDLRHLTSAEGLILPNTIGGGLYLIDLKSAEGLILPNTIWGDLYLERLTSLEGLIFPPNFELKGNLYSNYFVKEDLLQKAREQNIENEENNIER